MSFMLEVQYVSKVSKPAFDAALRKLAAPPIPSVQDRRIFLTMPWAF